MDQIKKLRVDKWLWQARFFKTRSIASRVISSGRLRVNSKKVIKPSFMVVIEDVLTFAQEKRIRVVEVKALGTRRGPASEAQELYIDRSSFEELFPKASISYSLLHICYNCMVRHNIVCYNCRQNCWGRRK